MWKIWTQSPKRSNGEHVDFSHTASLGIFLSKGSVGEFMDPFSTHLWRSTSSTICYPIYVACNTLFIEKLIVHRQSRRDVAQVTFTHFCSTMRTLISKAKTHHFIHPILNVGYLTTNNYLKCFLYSFGEYCYNVRTLCYLIWKYRTFVTKP